ncbi:MAG: hypothetical protein NZ585_02030 [Chloracidobacterium sp.]|nr:hypothetical protein [Chloracidobacterium sp.]
MGWSGVVIRSAADWVTLILHSTVVLMLMGVTAACGRANHRVLLVRPCSSSLTAC